MRNQEFVSLDKHTLEKKPKIKDHKPINQSMRNSKATNMARQKPSDHIETLKKQQAELAKKLKEAQTKARSEAKEFQRHKNELAGAVALKELEANPSGAFALALLGLLAKDLTRAGDRAVFDLTPLTKETKSAPVAAAPAPAASPAPSLAAAPAPFFPAKAGGDV
jgi:hypothetical protein